MAAPFKKLTKTQQDEWRKQTDDRIKEIRSSPNMEIPAGATVYYVSNKGNDSNDGRSPQTAWATLDKVSLSAIPEGSYVCFERGGLWRGQLKTQKGVTYTAYGTGNKPTLYASPMDGAYPSMWTRSGVKNVWVFEKNWKVDIGTLVFNHGETHAKKIVPYVPEGQPEKTAEDFYSSLDSNLHFFHDSNGTGKLYLYSEKNPADRFESIEFNVKRHVVSAKSGVTVDNFCIKYGGAHGVSAATVENLTVQNCEIGWIGGSIQKDTVRYGNGVEVYGGCDGFSVTDNYIYQIYDAGITQQYNLRTNDEVVYQKNMTYARNIIEYCNYSIEYFLKVCPTDNPSRMENFLIEDNLMWYSGWGLCEQRPDLGQGAHIKGWSFGGQNRAINYVIKNNLMFGANDKIMEIKSDLFNPDGSHSLPSVSGNQIVGVENQDFGNFAVQSASLKYGWEAVLSIDSNTDGTDVFWLMEE